MKNRTEILKALIQESGLNPRQFSLRFGIQQTIIYTYISGKKLVKMTKLEQIASELNLKLTVNYELERNNHQTVNNLRNNSNFV
jgi:predicted transcriptional regulator